MKKKKTSLSNIMLPPGTWFAANTANGNRESLATIQTDNTRESELILPATPNLGIKSPELKKLNSNQMQQVYGASNAGQRNKMKLNNMPLEEEFAKDLNQKQLLKQRQDILKRLTKEKQEKERAKRANRAVIYLVLLALLLVTGLTAGIVSTLALREPSSNLTTSRPTTTPTVSPTKLPTTSPTPQPTQLPTTSPSPNPTTAFPTSEPTNNPTSFPTDSPTGFPTGLFEFNFQRRNNIKEICGPNMDPSYAINGRFFSACAQGRSLVCFQDDGDDTLGVLEEFSCDENDLECLCPELLLFTPVEADIRVEDLCGERDDPEPLECSTLRETIDFIDNSIPLTTPSGLLNQMAEFCLAPEGTDVQVCLHEGLRLECRNIEKDDDFEVKACKNNEPCDCGVNKFIFGKLVDGIEICNKDLDFGTRCEP